MNGQSFELVITMTSDGQVGVRYDAKGQPLQRVVGFRPKDKEAH